MARKKEVERAIASLVEAGVKEGRSAAGRQMRQVRHVIIRRSRDENTCAAIVAWAEKGKPADKDFLGALKAALAEWKKTPAGAAAWKESSEDFNAGDLSTCDSNPGLTALLRDQGIHGFRIETFCDDSPLPWDYDDVLMPRD